MPSTPRSRLPPGELALIERIRARAAGVRSSVLKVGIGDDCAVLRPRPGRDVVVTTDLSLEGRHFRRDWHPSASVGHRALARGLSDLAAMGAKPMAAFLSLALPRAVARDQRWMDGFLHGLLALAAEHGVPLAGGDTAESPTEHVLLDIVLMGSVPTGRALLRSGARVGDRIYCTGALGGAAVELAGLATKRPPAGRAGVSSKVHPHLYPQPRLAAGQALLRRSLATACIDLSDGLSTDLAHLCAASGVGAIIEAERLPLHPLTRPLGPKAALEAALHGGEDYELLFTVSPEKRVPRTLGGVTVTKIGRIVLPGRQQGRQDQKQERKPASRAPRRQSAPIQLMEPNGHCSALQPRGWEHLA